jgi:hypothetical protein
MEVPTLFLGVIAAAVVLMSAVQVTLVFYGARLAHRVNRLVDKIEKDIEPALNRVNVASGDVTRATSLAVAQLERVDQLFARFTDRFEHLMNVSQDAVVEPLRRSVALVAGLRAAVTALRDAATGKGDEASEAVAEDQEPLFIG